MGTIVATSFYLPITPLWGGDTRGNLKCVKVPDNIRTIYITGSLNEEGGAEFIATFTALERKSPGPIRVVLLSEGGSERVGWAIYDTFRQSKCKVVVDVLGCAYSMAALVLQGADYRRISKEARVMVHAGTISLEDHTDQKTFVALGEELKKTNERYCQVMSERTGIPLDKMQDLCGHESYFTSEEALEAGFVDAVVPYAIKRRYKHKPVQRL